MKARVKYTCKMKTLIFSSTTELNNHHKEAIKRRSDSDQMITVPLHDAGTCGLCKDRDQGWPWALASTKPSLP